jgi:NitT/TauT family transport system substrate-binding protein
MLILALSLSACVSPAKEGQPEPVKLKVVQLPYLTYAPYFIALEEGHFAEQGLEIELLKFDRSSEAILPLAKGELDVLGGAATFGLLNAMAREGNIQLVAGRGYLPPKDCAFGSVLARRSLLESGALDSPEQMQGLRVAVAPASVAGYILDRVLEQAGLTFDDVDIVDLPNPAMLDAMANDSIDLAVIAEPWVSRLVQAGNAASWIPYSQVAPDFQLGYIAFGPSLLEENRDAGQRFITAYLKAVRQYSEGKTARNLEIMAKHTGLDEEFLEQACWPSYHQDGTINTQSVIDFQEWALEQGYQDSQIPVEQFWEPRFVEGVED